MNISNITKAQRERASESSKKINSGTLSGRKKKRKIKNMRQLDKPVINCKQAHDLQ